MIASCMLKSCSMFDESSRLLYLIRSTYALRCFSSKCLIRDRHVLHRKRSLFWFDETYKQSSYHSTLFSSCQCRRDISEVANFCLTWIARDLRQWTNQLDKTVNDFIVVCLYQIREYVSAQSSHWSDSRIRALSVLLSFSSERISSTKCQWFYRRMHHVFEYAFAQSSRRSTRESLHYSILMSFIHRWSRLMHILEQKRDHSNTKSFSIENLSKNVIFRKNEIILTRSLSLLKIFRRT